MEELRIIADNKVLVGLTVVVILATGLTLVWQLAKRVSEFWRLNHQKWSATKSEYLLSLANAAHAAKHDHQIMSALLWVRLCRILSNFIYFFFALASLSLIRIAARRSQIVSIEFDEFVQAIIFIMMMVSGVVIAFNIFEINKICRTTLKIKTGHERGY